MVSFVLAPAGRPLDPLLGLDMAGFTPSNIYIVYYAHSEKPGLRGKSRVVVSMPDSSEGNVLPHSRSLVTEQEPVTKIY